MKLMLMIIGEEYIADIKKNLADHGYYATEIASTGEFLQYGDVVLLLGIAEGSSEDVMKLLSNQEQCDQEKKYPYNGEVNIFVINMDDFRKLS